MAKDIVIAALLAIAALAILFILSIAAATVFY